MSKKIAFVHDRIHHLGGAESVMKSFIVEAQHKFHDCEIMIFCGFSNMGHLEVGGKKIRIITALPQRIFRLFTWGEKSKMPVISKLLDYRNLMFFYPQITRSLSTKINQFSFDEVYVDSFAFAKNIEIKQPIKLYLHQPMQYIRSLYKHNLSKLKAPISWFYRIAALYLRPWDKKPRNYEYVVCNSLTTQKEAREIYGISNSSVQYPPIDQYYFECGVQPETSDYYVFVGRVVIFLKDVDRIVHLFNQTGKKIKIIGNGPDLDKLKEKALPNVEFLGSVYGQDKYDIVAKSKGLISLGRESFGMTAIEALCQGVPVLCYSKSASSEFICEETGVTCESLDINQLEEKLDYFESKKWDRSNIQRLGRFRYNLHKKNVFIV